ncbi:helix-turn-helix transcriptional regulator [Pedobacter cryoconitis]|uniref:Tetratricopeptide (TPR) repeat protein n=1 Tax=Pedobacter cryoconitis TaxID=188932 RepID=A0A7X0J4Y3_9SPHI|nr:hypothetical protein [Pedobacter cryoconitis]MBB6500948.1 tetratricopeptide (TPR) repeat protein [Pedobacter cryoconitis]
MQNANSIEEKTEIEHEVYDLSTSIGYHEGLIAGKLHLLNEMVNSCRFDQSLKLINQHMDEALQLNVPLYSLELLSLKSTCYLSLGFKQESRTVMEQARSFAQELKNDNEYHYAMGQIYAQMAWNYKTTNNELDSVLFYYRNSSKEFAKLNIKPEANIFLFDVFNRMGMIYFEKKQYDSAQKYLPYIYRIKEKGRNKSKLKLLMEYMTDANLSFIRKDYQKSLAGYQDALDLSISLKLIYYQKTIYKELVQVYAQLGNQRKQVISIKQYAQMSDSISRIEKREIRQSLETIIKDKDAAGNKDTTYYVMIVTVQVFLIAGSLFFLSNKKRGLKKRTEPIVNLLPINRNSEQTLNDLIELAKRNSSILYTRFNEFDSTFCKRLLAIAPGLLITEQELCIYIRLNFDTKEIATYNRSSIKAIQARKHRLRKKLNIPTKEDLTNWILNF